MPHAWFGRYYTPLWIVSGCALIHSRVAEAFFVKRGRTGTLALFRIRGIMVVAEAIGRRLLPVRHAIVPNYAGNAQSVVTKHACSSHRLGDAVRLQFSPLFHCCLISKEGE